MDFFEEEAEVGSSEESPLSGEDDLTNEAPKPKKKDKKKKKQRRVVDSDDSDEEDGEELDQDLEGLINDDVEEESDVSDGEGSGPGTGKRRHSEEEEEEELSDEDYALLEENLGIKVKRKKRSRIRMVSDDEDSGKDEHEEEADQREVIAREIFEDDDMEGEGVEAESYERPAPPTHGEEFGDLEASDAESDEDDFIVDDEGQPVSKGKKKRHIIHDDAALQEAQDIFGVDFDFDEFEQYGDEYEDDVDEDEEMEAEEEEEGEEGGERQTRRQRKAAKKHSKKTTIFEVFEPSELERSHFTDLDQEIRAADMPERFRLRGIPICPGEKGELKEESEWIYRNAFLAPPLSRQEYFDQDQDSRSGGGKHSTQKGPGTSSKIHEALKFMRNQQFEVPFIAFYRKEYIDPDLNINDLWKVYNYDEKWMQLRQRKQNLEQLLRRMQQYQYEKIDPESVLDASVRTLTNEDIERVQGVQSMEELKDVYQHFLLYYGPDIPKMKQSLKAKKKLEQEGEGKEDEGDANDDQDIPKQASRKSGYTMCTKAGLAELARKFGLTPEQFGENVRDNYERHEVEQDPSEPRDLAEEFIKGQFSTREEVLRGACHMVAMQIAHDPLFRQCVRTTFYERAKISLQATKKGVKEIDEVHPCYTFKYLTNKTVSELQEDQFLKIQQAADDGLLTYEIHIDEKNNSRIQSYFDEIKPLYAKDEFSNLVQEWNEQRALAVERALNLILFPQLIAEVKAKLLMEAQESIIRACCRKLYSHIKVAPYQVDQPLDDVDEEETDSSHGVRVMSIAYSTDRNEASFCALVDGDGEVTDFQRVVHLLTRKDSWRTDERHAKVKEQEQIKNFILNKKPHVIVIGGESREALMISEDLRQILADLEQEHQMVPISIEIMDNELSKIYANCKKGQQDFREYPELLRQAVSLARRLQDPLVEFAQLCNTDEDILALRYHPLQSSVSKEELVGALYLEFVNRVNEVGVDVNWCVAHPHTASLVQFVCGLGPRKGYHLLKTLKQNNSRLENRTQLVTMTHARMGPKVFINCAGFIKIDTNALGDSTEAYVEVLDGSRVHPETYEWARKMAVDALEYDDTAEDANPAGALEEILESPERLRDLDLDAFAEELDRQGYGDKHITLYDIRAELNHRYKDLRVQYRSPSLEERFNMLTKETPQTFYIGKLIMCSVMGIAHRRPGGEQLDNANPVRDDETGLWQCPFCKKNNFPELSEVWNHFDAQECRGQAVGVRTRLDNSIGGFIPLKCLSDKHVTNPEDRVKVGMTLHCRITKIDIDRFQVELTSRTSDLVDKDSKWKLQKDPCYDHAAEEQDIKREESKQKHQARQTYIRRVIAHPSFHNIDYKQCEKLMMAMEQGEVIIRPSSKGTDRLTVSWKLAEGIVHHIDVKEEGKENAFSLGSSLFIEGEAFEDLDEIIARHIQPMAAFARDILNYKYYKSGDGGSREVMDKFCLEEKRKAPSRIPYYFSASREFPGKFLLSYTPRNSTKFELVTVTPEGLRYRSQIFPSLNGLVRWFKEHFRDPIPGTPSIKTPLSMTGSANPSGTPMSNLDPSTVQRAAARLPSSVYNTLSQVAAQTPFGGAPLSTPVMTPMMTTPAQQALLTPQHGLSTPLATPQYQPTPRTNFQPTATRPQTTPRANNTFKDWGKMAQIWAKSQQGEGQGQKSKSRRGGGGTPRPEASPMINSSGGGAETPLFDER